MLKLLFIYNSLAYQFFLRYNHREIHMTNVNFHRSDELTIGAEIELQLIDPEHYSLVARAKDLIRRIHKSSYNEQIKPEITQGMIEINSHIHKHPQSLHDDLLNVAHFLTLQGNKLGIEICGGGTHPFQKWTGNKIFPTLRFKQLSRQYRYLSKLFTVFALHLHIGCKNGDDAIYLTHLLSRFTPHFIALSASSPFYLGIDSGFNSSRSNVVGAFPLSGTIPFVLNWREFSEYYLKMRDLQIVSSMKDFYWDIRPKPTFGTIEIRVCDTPLTLMRTISIIAYIQAIARYLLLEKPLPLTQDLYTLYNHNRFQASRYGFEGQIVNPFTLERKRIDDDILETLKLIKPHAIALKSLPYLRHIQTQTTRQLNDAAWQRKIFAKKPSQSELVKQQCRLWREQFHLST